MFSKTWTITYQVFFSTGKHYIWSSFDAHKDSIHIFKSWVISMSVCLPPTFTTRIRVILPCLNHSIEEQKNSSVLELNLSTLTQSRTYCMDPIHVFWPLCTACKTSLGAQGLWSRWQLSCISKLKLFRLSETVLSERKGGWDLSKTRSQGDPILGLKQMRGYLKACNLCDYHIWSINVPIQLSNVPNIMQ